LWLWFVGMIVTTFPWHYVGILGMPRRMASYDYTNPGAHRFRLAAFAIDWLRDARLVG
jgi:heme/copper-type cytochrome/quinol oxidase subunit 1